MGLQRVGHHWATKLNWAIKLLNLHEDEEDRWLYWSLKVKKWKSLSCVWLFVTPWTIQFMEISRPKYWSGYLSLLQGIFPTQGLNPGLPHCSQILYQLSHKRSPRILEWVAFLFCSRSSQPRNWTGVSYTAGEFFINCTLREAPIGHCYNQSLA